MNYIKDFQENAQVEGIYLCKSKMIGVTKNGNDYMSAELADKTGTFSAKIWDVNSAGIQDFDEGDYVEVSGQTKVFKGQMQMKVDRLRVASSDEYDISDYVPSSRFDINDMFKQVLALAESVENPYLRQLLKAFFVDDTDFVSKFTNISAAKSVHHAFCGGLLEHSLSVATMCDSIAKHYDFLNRDLLITSALLHDCGKTVELSAFPKNDYTDEGNFLGHIVIGVEMINRKAEQIKDFPTGLRLQLDHCIVSHHHELEYGSPKKPALSEAMALGYADDLDAKMETFREALENVSTDEWLGFNRWIDSNIRRTDV